MKRYKELSFAEDMAGDAPQYASIKKKALANGMRNLSRTPLTDKEIEFIKKEIRIIEADESVFIFNDPNHIAKSTCYNVLEDKIYVTRNIFPDDAYGSTHPRDLMSVRAVLAHEYYGHRVYRDEYLLDISNDVETTPYWKDECRASITAAKTTPNLTERDRCNLVQDASYRAKESGNLLIMDDFMKEVTYGYSDGEKGISKEITQLFFISEASQRGAGKVRRNKSNLSEVRKNSKDYDDFT